MINKTDRELLELAAKAAGIQLDFAIRGDFPPYYVNERGGHSSWNPLTDDGDALRLAAKLKLNVMQGDFSVFVTDEAEIEDVFFVKDETHRLYATRLAIVRAAAEIGRGME